MGNVDFYNARPRPFSISNVRGWTAKFWGHSKPIFDAIEGGFNVGLRSRKMTFSEGATWACAGVSWNGFAPRAPWERNCISSEALEPRILVAFQRGISDGGRFRPIAMSNMGAWGSCQKPTD